jgi:hypothetical protein
VLAARDVLEGEYGSAADRSIADAEQLRAAGSIFRAGALSLGSSIQNSWRSWPSWVHVAAIIGKLDPAVAAITAWLSAGSHAAQLAALGYDAEGLTQLLSSAEALITVASIGIHDGTVELGPVIPQLQQQLQALGIALTSFAHPNACNNPLCSNLAEASEAALVQGGSSRCSVCRAARYCTKACQVLHWKQHKHVCKRLAPAATAAAAGSGPGKGADPV